MPDCLLRCADIAAGYGLVRVLNGVELDVARGSVTALLGSNGAGKTTLMRTLAGLLVPTSGRIQLGGVDITAWPAHRRVEAGLALVPEGRRVFPELSVVDNLRLGAVVPRARAEWHEQLAAAFELFPRLAERRSQSAGLLSGGEQQMLALARGLMSQPRLLLLDEPTLGLAPRMVETIFDAIRRLKAQGTTILIAEQDVMTTLGVSDDCYVVENGHIVLSGPSAILADDPRIRTAYLGL